MLDANLSLHSTRSEEVVEQYQLPPLSVLGALWAFAHADSPLTIIPRCGRDHGFFHPPWLRHRRRVPLAVDVSGADVRSRHQARRWRGHRTARVSTRRPARQRAHFPRVVGVDGLWRRPPLCPACRSSVRPAVAAVNSGHHGRENPRTGSFVSHVLCVF